MIDDAFVDKIDTLTYKAKSKYFGREYAKNPNRELKGASLLSNSSFKLAKKFEGQIPFIKNHAIVKELLGYLVKEREDEDSSHYIRVFASAVFGPNPQLLCRDHARIPVPYRWLCRNVSRAVEKHAPKDRAILIYDQRFQSQTSLAITLRGFNAGLKLRNLHPVPYFGVSHATPCLQISDIIVYIISRHLAGKKHFEPFYDMVRRLQWTAEVDGSFFYGINSWREDANGRYYKK